MGETRKSLEVLRCHISPEAVNFSKDFVLGLPWVASDFRSKVDEVNHHIEDSNDFRLFKTMKGKYLANDSLNPDSSVFFLQIHIYPYPMKLVLAKRSNRLQAFDALGAGASGLPSCL